MTPKTESLNQKTCHLPHILKDTVYNYNHELHFHTLTNK